MVVDAVAYYMVKMFRLCYSIVSCKWVPVA